MRRIVISAWLALLSGCGKETGGPAPAGDLSARGAGDLAAVADLISGTGEGGSPADIAAPAGDAATDDAALDLAVEPDLAPAADLAAPDDAEVPCAMRCQNGCCQGEVCLPPSPQTGCATKGAACVPCPAETDSCVNEACSCGMTGGPCGAGLACVGGACTCTGKNCPGCCADAKTCVMNATLQQCGSGGAVCVDCGNTANQCFLGKCVCAGGAPCGANAVCDPGKGCLCNPKSCGMNGACVPIAFPTCGAPGGACGTCDKRKSSACDPMTGDCLCGDKPACGPGYYCDITNAPVCRCDTMPGGCAGCCSKDGKTCVAVVDDKQCGIDGATCADCTASGGTCDTMKGVCLGCQKTCTGMNNGCCAGNTCIPVGNQSKMTGCGANGLACDVCGLGADRCLNGVCSCGNLGKECAAGLECIGGQCACTIKSCPNGCCEVGACRTIGLQYCGVPGGGCMACNATSADRCLMGACSCGAGGKTCVQGQRCLNGACVCDVQSCPMGCCSNGICNPISIVSCAKPGAACVSCDPKLADGCTNGACTCGGASPCGPGLACVNGKCACAQSPCATCAAAAAAHSYIGCEYWPTVTFQGAWSIFDFAVVVANPQPVQATVTTTGPNGFNNVTTIQPGQLAKIYLPWVASLKGPDMNSCGGVTATTASVMARGSAYKVVSTVPVSAYQFSPIEYQGTGGPPGKSWAQCPGTVLRCPPPNGINQPIGCYSFTNDASLLIPTAAMTGNYRVAGMTGWTIPGYGPAIGAFMAITGTTANTTVSVRLSAAGTIVASSGNVIPARAGGQTVTFTLNAGDVAQVLTPAGSNYDLSGSLVSANQPVQVITGNQCINVPANKGYCDHIEESVLPAETLGKRYAVTVPTSPLGNAVGHVVRIYGNFANTKLTYVPAPASQNAAPATIQPGVVYDLGQVTNNFVVTGDQPFLVSSFQLGSSVVDPNTAPPTQQGDPSQSQVVAIEQYRTQYIFLAPSDYNVSYADLVIPTGATVTLDGNVVGGAPSAIGNSGFGLLRVKLGAGNNGAHTLTSSAPVGLQVMGYGSYTSYQYPGGLDLNLIANKPMDM